MNTRTGIVPALGARVAAHGAALAEAAQGRWLFKPALCRPGGPGFQAQVLRPGRLERLSAAQALEDIVDLDPQQPPPTRRRWCQPCRLRLTGGRSSNCGKTTKHRSAGLVA